MKILVSPISKEIQNKIIVKYHFKPIKMAKIRKKKPNAYEDTGIRD